MSSKKPNRKTVVAHTRIPMDSLSIGTKTKYGITKDKNKAIPPNRAAGFLFHLSSLGSTTNPCLLEILMMMGVITKERRKEEKKRSRYLSILFISVKFDDTFYDFFDIVSRFVPCQFLNSRDIRHTPSHVLKTFLIGLIIGDMDDLGIALCDCFH